jgi:transposase-like protein
MDKISEKRNYDRAFKERAVKLVTGRNIFSSQILFAAPA